MMPGIWMLSICCELNAVMRGKWCHRLVDHRRVAISLYRPPLPLKQLNKTPCNSNDLVAQLVRRAAWSVDGSHQWQQNQMEKSYVCNTSISLLVFGRRPVTCSSNICSIIAKQTSSDIPFAVDSPAMTMSVCMSLHACIGWESANTRYFEKWVSHLLGDWANILNETLRIWGCITQLTVSPCSYSLVQLIVIVPHSHCLWVALSGVSETQGMNAISLQVKHSILEINYLMPLWWWSSWWCFVVKRRATFMDWLEQSTKISVLLWPFWRL